MVHDEGALALADMLHHHDSMTLLNLRRQTPGLTDQAAMGFANALRSNTKLEHLRFCRNKIGDVGAVALANALSERLGRLGALLGAADLRFELGLESNRVREKGLVALLRVLRAIPAEAHCVELLVHGNLADRGALLQAVVAAADQSVQLDASDPRLSFAPKPESHL